MKTENIFSTNFLTKMLALSLFVLLVNCSELAQEEAIPQTFVSEETSQDWVALLDQLELESTIIVQKNELIQNAVDAALPGDVIYIEPGVYDEVLNINKSELRFVGLDNSIGERVILNNPVSGNDVEFFNIDGQVQSHDINNLSNARKAKRRCLLKMDRVDLGKGIAHYTFDLKLGDGEFDVVTVHRVVKEKRPYRPIRTKGDIFMIHGAIQDFDDIFLTAGAEVINEKTSSPFYLALDNIDVWGVDLGWTKVPIETTDFSFMLDWGVEKDVNHTLKAMSIARIIRGLSGQSFCRMNLLGFSYGLNVAYGAANRETQQHRILRDVKGIIPVDSRLTTDIESIQDIKCAEAENWLGVMDGGQYHHPWGVGLIFLGEVALGNPDGYDFDPSMTFTNSQYAEFAGTQGFFGGEEGKMLYTDPLRFFKLSANLVPHMPAQMFYDMPAGGCPDRDESYVEHLNEIKVPILYIGAGGGAAETGFYTCTQTSSVDKTQIVVSVTSNPAVDYGHADLWMARDADEMLWVKLHGWLINH